MNSQRDVEIAAFKEAYRKRVYCAVRWRFWALYSDTRRVSCGGYQTSISVGPVKLAIFHARRLREVARLKRR